MIEVVAALIWNGERFLICQRPKHKARGLLWEYVGGKVEPGEAKEEALIRECREELGVTVSVGDVFMDVVHEYPDITVHLTLFHASIAEGTIRLLEHNAVAWITPAEIPDYAFCPADKEINERIATEFTHGDLQYLIRDIRKSEIELLDTFLYEAIFVPKGSKPPERDIIEKPELRVYTESFGTRKGDHCLVADYGGKIVGAVWTRIMNDYGHIDDETPSFAISILKEYRKHGIGSQLMVRMLELLKRQGYKQATLAVQKANYAVRMYKNIGFKVIDENDEEYIMVFEL